LIVEPGRGKIPDEILPAPGADVVVRAMFSGISRGTEALAFRGQCASERQNARPFQSGHFPR
jgi:hypothetical protein